MYKGAHLVEFLLTILNSSQQVRVAFAKDFSSEDNLIKFYELLCEFDTISERDTGFVLRTDYYLVLLAACMNIVLGLLYSR